MHRHVDNDLSDLKDLLLTMGGCVERAIDEVHEGMINKSEMHFDRVREQETQINKLHTKVDKKCLRILARQAPVATDLRLCMSVVKINTDLERMGDQCMNILHNARDYIALGGGEIPKEFHEMKKQVREMVKTSLDAFVRQDLALCRDVLDNDDVVDDFRNQLVDSLRIKMKSNPDEMDTYLHLIMIAKNMERVADHATNIAEGVIFVITGDDIRHGRAMAKSI